MTKEELIQSFPKDTVSMTPWFMGAASLAIIAALGVTIYFKKVDAQIIIPTFIGTLIFGILVGSMGFHFSKANLQSEQYKWRAHNFYAKYLPTVPEEKLMVVDQIINENGSVTVTVETDAGERKLENLFNISYFPPTQTRSEPYVLARWVSGLESIGISKNYYDITLHLPRKG